MIQIKAPSMRRLLGLVAILVATMPQCDAQQVLAAAGGSFGNASHIVAFTLGEPVIATAVQSTVIATQGFHQPADDFTTTVTIVADPAMQVLAFPNPAREEVTVVVEGTDRSVTLEAFDAIGRAIPGPSTFTGRVTMDVRSLASGTYHLRLTANGRYLSTVQLIIAH